MDILSELPSLGNTGIGYSGRDRKNPSMILLSRTVIVTPEQAVTSVTQTASNTRLDAGCQIGELSFGISWSTVISAAAGCSGTTGLWGLPIVGGSVAVSRCCFGGASLAVLWAESFDDEPLTLDPGRLTRSRAIPRGPCFRRFFTTGGVGGSGDAGGSGAGTTTAFGVVDGLSTFGADNVGLAASAVVDRESSSSFIRRFSVSASGGRPRGRFTPSILTFFACSTHHSYTFSTHHARQPTWSL